MRIDAIFLKKKSSIRCDFDCDAIAIPALYKYIYVTLLFFALGKTLLIALHFSSCLGLHVQNLSEPVELLVPTSADPIRSGRVEELRRSFTNKRTNLRRQTAAGVPLDGFDDLAQSEDSVFVNDGYVF